MGVNRVILLGNLGRDPEVRYTTNNTPVCTLNLATSERRKDQSGNWVDHTEWHNVVLFGRTAELAQQYLKKGRQVYIEGSLRTRKWQDKEGKDRYTTEIVASSMQFVGAKEGGGARSEPPMPREESSPRAAPAAASATAAEEVAFEDDDIPF